MISLRQDDPHEGTLRDLAPDLTPMLDILFILLVFFMLTAGAALQSLDVKLPSSVSDSLPLMQEPQHLMLEIRPNAYAINGKVVADFAGLERAIPEAIRDNPEKELIIASDKQVSVENLLKVLTYLQSQGITAANILMQQENQK